MLLCDLVDDRVSYEDDIVSILVLVDVALRPLFNREYSTRVFYVSILVLVDVALRQNVLPLHTCFPDGFNPCFSGCCSATFRADNPYLSMQWGFNPCFSGCCSATVLSPFEVWTAKKFQSLF